MREDTVMASILKYDSNNCDIEDDNAISDLFLLLDPQSNLDHFLPILILAMLQRDPITLSWKDLSAQVKDKRLISNCTGYCNPGEMLAIMGASGAGKTTLLSLLCQKADKQLKFSGNVYANNHIFDSSSFYNFGVYVYQNDTLHEILTVRETLEFTAKLKTKDLQQAQERVNEMIKLFQLQKCENSYVGGQVKKGVSGGEKKRICIAVEMITKPSLLILDEPTSGLDSHKASSVVKVLRKLANQGCTIIFTIHQPSYLLYSMLSNLILLDKGHTIYQGPAHKIAEYIASLKIAIPEHSTISDFFIWEISEFNAQKNTYTTPLNNQNYTLRIAPQIEQSMQSLTIQKSGYEIISPVSNFLFMFSILLRRQFIIFFRNPMRLVGCILNAIVGIIIVGVFYLNEIPSTDALIQQGTTGTYQAISYHFIGIQGVAFINITSLIMGGIFSVQMAFVVEREIYYKESSSKKYYPSAYFCSKVIVNSINAFLSAVLYGSAAYWLNGFDPDFSKFIKYLLALLFMAMCGNSIGFFIGAMFKEASQAAAIGPLITLPMMAFSGMYNKLNSTPTWISWLSYISPFRYGLHLIMENQYEGLIIDMPGPDVYDYRADMDIQYSYSQNLLITATLACGIYACSFLLLKKLSSQLSS